MATEQFMRHYYGASGFVSEQDRRLAIAKQIIRRVDTVTLLSVEEVKSIRERALNGEFDSLEFNCD